MTVQKKVMQYGYESCMSNCKDKYLKCTDSISRRFLKTYLVNRSIIILFLTGCILQMLGLLEILDTFWMSITE